MRESFFMSAGLITRRVGQHLNQQRGRKPAPSLRLRQGALARAPAAPRSVALMSFLPWKILPDFRKAVAFSDVNCSFCFLHSFFHYRCVLKLRGQEKLSSRLLRRSAGEGELNFLGGLSVLVAPCFEIQLDGLLKIFFRNGERLGLSRDRQIKIARDEPTAVALEDCMDCSHGRTVPRFRPSDNHGVCSVTATPESASRPHAARSCRG